MHAHSDARTIGKMKLRHLCFVLVAIGAVTAASACGGDDTAATGGDAGVDATSDAPATTDAASDAPGDGGPVGIAVADQSVYAGHAASLTVTTTTHTGGFMFAWSLVSAPTGSAVTTATLGPLNAPGVSFVPDVVGDYVVKVTVDETGYAPSTTMATVHAFAAPVFFARAIMDSNGGEVGIDVAGHDKSDLHAVACAINFGPNEEATYRTRTLTAAASSMDAWEAPAGQPSRFVFSGTSSLAQDDAGGYATFLIAGTTRNSCGTAPTTLRSQQAPAGAFSQPRFSPDGARVAFVDPVGASFGVSTIGFDGTGYRAVAPIYATPPSSGDESTNIRPEWQDATHLAWPRPLGGGAWSIVVASDAASATPATYMTCTGSTPHHIALLSDGSIVTSYSPTANAPSDLYVLKPDASKACTVVHKLTSLGGSNASRAHDFAVSPDQKTVAYLHYDATAHGGSASGSNEGDLYVVPVDGSAAAKAVGTATSGRIGPRWIGGGSRLAWTRVGAVVDGGDPRAADIVTAVLPDGGASTDIVAGDGLNTIVAAAGPGGSCAIAHGPAYAEAIALLLAAVALVRRRR